MKLQEFKITNDDNLYRIGKITPIELLASSTLIGGENLNMTMDLFKFALEHAEVKLGEKWFPVKAKDAEVYSPNGIENNMLALNEIAKYIFKEAIVKSFTKSNE